MSTPSRAVLKITLDGVEPAVMRRIVVPADIRLDRLHLVIQAAMGWTNSHLYESRIGDAGWGVPDPDGFYDGPLEAKKGRLGAVLADAGRKTFNYLYDFGDGWSTPPNLKRSRRWSRVGPASCGSTPSAAAHQRIAAARRATRACSKSSPIPTMRRMKRRSRGAEAGSIRFAQTFPPLKAQLSVSCASTQSLIRGRHRMLTSDGALDSSSQLS